MGASDPRYTVYIKPSAVREIEAIEHACRAAGYEPPVICTPEELTDDQGS